LKAAPHEKSRRTMTIFALSSARGRAGVAVIRLSGEMTANSVKLLINNELPKEREAALKWIYNPRTAERLDKGLILWFPAPHSFTGEDVAELQIHGGKAVVDAVLAALGSLPGLRPAEPGEFARRAFDNGRMDLTEVEGLADLVNAETEGQRRQALRQMEGALGDLYEGWRAELIEYLALHEAAIDFADEDLPDDLTRGMGDKISGLVMAIEAHLQDGWRGERLRDGFKIAILGAPNAGKSTLLNALARREAAIVSEEAGTTRDVIEVHLDLNGFAVIVADTAGIREEGGNVEREGMRRALKSAEMADLKIILVDGRVWPEMDDGIKALIDETSLLVVNKTDLTKLTPSTSRGSWQNALGLWFLSAKTGDGLAFFLRDLGDIIKASLEVKQTDMPRMTRERHRQALNQALSHLQRYLQEAGDIEMKAEDIRLAARSLGRITGRVDVEDVLDVIFSEFCIGK
jgi:tRNA modification GTPase